MFCVKYLVKKNPRTQNGQTRKKGRKKGKKKQDYCNVPKPQQNPATRILAKSGEVHSRRVLLEVPYFPGEIMDLQFVINSTCLILAYRATEEEGLFFIYFLN